jgi:hypothetical protein
LRQARARPGPTAELLQAFIIDIDDDGREGLDGARCRSLKGIKPQISHRPPSRFAEGDLRQSQQRQEPNRRPTAIARAQTIEQELVAPTAAGK